MAFIPKKFTVTKTRPNDTTAYTAEDVISEANSSSTSWNFADARTSPGLLVGARLYFNDEKTPRTILHLYTTAAPTNTELDDNDQFGIMYESEDEKIGEINFPAASGEDASVGNGSRAQNFDLRIPIIGVPAGQAGHIYGILETLDGFTPVANTQFTIDLYIVSGE